MTDYSITVSSISIALGDLEGRLDNLRPLYASWGAHVERIAVLSFKRQQDPTGQPWKELNPRYRQYKENYAKNASARRRRAKKLGQTTNDRRGNPVSGGRLKLRWSGALYSSIYSRPTDSGVEVGTSIRVGQWSLGGIHQFGRKDGSISARPFLPIESNGALLPAVERDLTQMAIDYLIKG